MMFRRTFFAAIAASLFWLSPAQASDQPQDAWITTKVKMSLITAEAVDGLDINVDTINGQVTLHGIVGSELEKTRAEERAKGVKGVARVRNLLQVVAEERQEKMAFQDEEIEGRIAAALTRDLPNTNVSVKSVNNGTVLLQGNAKTLTEHRRALEVVRSVKGVERVASEIKSPNELGDAEIWAEDGQESVSSTVSDVWITTKSKMALMSEPGLSPFSINVDTHDGVVTLFGIVGTQNVKEAAETRLKGIDGVARVKNELQVVPNVSAERVQEKDEVVQEAVVKALGERKTLAGSDIDVEVKDGVVRLSGKVESQGDRFTAATVARNAKGAKSVIDDLRIN